MTEFPTRIMEEKQQIILANQDGATVAGAAPTFFVILKQPGNGKTDQGILVTNRDACALASSVSSPGKSKGKICLPADCTVGGITVTLDNNSMWNEFYHRSTEMILTKQGRRMFPYCRYWITGLDSNMKYILVMDISPVDNHRYKWNGRWWEPSGKAEPHVLGRVFIHPESPSTGHYWMHQPVSFYKLKLTNNTLDQEGHIILHSMHRYLPRLHLVPAEKATEVIQLNGPGVHTFTFPQTEFFAVTAYQNIQITQLKIDYNPFAKGFRDDGLNSKPQRDGKQKNSSDQEGNSVPSSPGQRVRLTEGEGSEIQLTDSDPLLRGHETSGKCLEKPSLSMKRDFLGFMDIDSALGEVPQLKQEVSESLVANNFEDGSHVVSPLDPNGNFNVVIKEEPVDDYEYELAECPEGVTIKQEETDEETDVYSNSDDDPILEKQLKRHNKVDNLEADHPSSKWLPNSPSGVAQAKMFKLDAGKMPVVYLEPCAVTKSTVKISELPDNMLSTSRKDKSSVLTELDYLPTYIENSNETGFCLGKESENGLRKHSPDLRMVQKYPLLKEPQWKYPEITDSINTERIPDSSKSSAGDSFLGKEDLGRRRTTMLKISTASKVVNANQNAPSNVPGKRGRPRKLKLSKAGRPPKNTGKSLTSTKNTPMGPGNTFPDVKPDLEDVDGVLFVSFESKEALDIHAVDGTAEEPCSLQASTTNDPGCRARISQLEKELIEDLKALRHKQVIHPGLQEVGLKLNSVDPTMSIDLKYLGVQLPLAPATSFPFWNLTGTNPSSPDAGFPFVSRTGKTNDFTKIKGWRGKFHSASASRSEGGNPEGPLKNRSAFCSDKLDEYLENEGKLMETSMGFSSNAPTSPVVYQLPTKSTSYVRTLDSVLKKQSTISPSTSYSLKPHSVPPASRKAKSQNKQATFGGRTKSSYKSILPYPVSPKQKHAHTIPGDKVAKNSSTISENQVNNFVVPTLDENTFPKQISLRQAHQQQQQQQQQGTRPPGLSKSQVKLMDLEDCALWEGKPRTYITEERADVSLTTLLTAQASLKTKPIHTIIRKRAPPCNNDFCRLGCVCSSLALEKRQPAHCRRPDCMFGCTCLKRKVVLVKGGSKAKHFQRKATHRDPVFYDALGEEQREEEEGIREEEDQLKEKKRRKKLEYTICETEPEQPVRHYPLWVKVEGEVDPEPVYIPTPSVIEPMKPLLLPQPEVLPTTVKGKVLTGIKPARAYTPKPNPVIREEDKDPVYLYFESMMTCARVRVYERKKEEQRQPSPSLSPSFQQPGSCQSNPENCSVKEPDSEQQPLKPITCDLEDDSDKSQEKSWKSSCNEGESSTSYVHQRSPGGPTKLIEIISDCNWEEDRNKILSILSQHINSNMPQSLKVGSFIIELASQRKSRGEKNPPVYSSRVKISMPSCQDQDDMAEKSGSETPDGPLSPGKMDDISPVQTDALDSVRERLHGGKGLPFYAGLSPAGKLVAYKRKPSSSTSGLIQVNGKSYPQAKLLLGQMGALHPANRLAAYITGRLRPSVLDLSTLSTVISKVASNAKVAASRKPRTLLPSTSNCKMASSSGATTNRPGKNLKAFVPAKRPIENAPQIPVATPQVSPNTVKRTGPRLLLIPVQQGSPTLRPVPNTQLQGHRMVLQPVRSPSGMNLFRHPNGQIVQLLPLHQLRGSNTQPNLQPVMFRNPGSVMGIRLPTPSKPSETPPSSASSSAFSVMNPVIQAVGSSPAVNVITQAPSLLSSGPSFVSQSGTLTLRISPPEPQSFASKAGSETKITYSSGGQPVGTASLIPLQSGSFALLQLPGQKPVPSSILQHVASLQMKRESQSADQKDETSFLKREQQDTKKTLQSEGEAIDSEANIIKQNSGAAASEEILHDSLGDGGDHLDEESLTEEGPITVKPSQPSCITASHIVGEDYKDDEEYGVRNENSSKEKRTLLEVKTISKKASNVTVQSVNSVQLKKLGDVKVEQQKGLENPEKKSNEFPIISKEDSKIELSGNKVVEQQSIPQPEGKEKGCGDSLEKDDIRERWRKHPKGPLTQKCVGTSQECKKEADEQLIKEIKTCQENSDMFQQEGIPDLLGKSGTTENVRVLKTECDSWSRISSPTAFSIVPRRATKGSRGEGHFQGHLLLSEQIQPKQETKGGRSSADLTLLDLEDEDEEDENEKTDDSIDEIVDVVSDYQSEEVDDVEKNNCVEYIEDDEEQVDIETVEDLSEEINVAHMKTTAAQTQTFKQPCRTHISTDEKAAERSRKAPPVPLKLKPDYWSEKLQKEAEAFAYYRRTHTANERRRRGEMRDLFEKLKITLGLLHSSKVSKSLILTRAFSEIQGLTDQADKLIGQKNLLTRKRNILIRKVSSLSGKTEEVVLKKLEYIYAKQQALEAQKRKKKMGSDEFEVSPRTSKQQEGSSASSVDLGQMFINNRKGKPLILSRKRDQATENTSPSNTPHTSANIVMTPQGQLLTLKGPLFSGPVVTVSPLLESDLKPQVATSAMAQSENDDLFMMPRIVNVTSLATEGGLVDMGGSKYSHEVPDGKPSDHLKSTIRNDDNSFEDSGRISSRSNHRDGRMALGPTPVFLANKDSGFPQIVDVSSMQEAQEFLPKKISGEVRGIQYKWKECESRREKPKPKESTFHKLKMKDLKDSSIEMELRKVASAIEEAALDPSELLTNMEDEDDTDETLTSLLNEIAFLNQQLNDDSVSLAELPSSMDTEFTGDARRAFISKLPSGNRATFQVGHLGSGLKELPDVQRENDSVSPLLLHLEDDDFSETEKQLAEPASEPDVLKIVIDSEIKDSLLSHRKASDGGKSTSGIPAEPESVSSPPILHMKAGVENSSTDTLWRPMPKLAPLGLKVANPSSDADGQSLKVMPCLAPVAAKVGSVGHKMNLIGNDQECRESKVMPTLAPVVAKLGNSGASPSSAGK
ncbi:MAX gene-associated protein isoform X5 [Canis lupus baileyi]|uniref:MAX gene-associated protein isoform X20 n=1 Tax=Canis lupus familiaris TaxID=9615 RepID=UPI0006B3D106|nr:MAX gene-associated protein isoform X20 [Canis lupus familiaris]XP_025328895.1 MAX gene-associated protein isoform X7 [Canis lupus dingo]XP_038436062.1 MAX gene-associated protein isoform X15 [Canis lupus familiaris]XP_048960376.1 MAX gene-associated protein isoform X7 [Canis lupus dingo]|eukprot:XP_013964901.1 MAX gene-associated protein isoform X6 [Canis lupus familiaris]